MIGSSVTAGVGIGAFALIDRPQQVGFGMGYAVLAGVIGAIVGVALAAAGSVVGVLVGSTSAALGVRRVGWIVVLAFATGAGVGGALLAPTFPLPPLPLAVVCAHIGAVAAAISFRPVQRTLSGNDTADESEAPSVDSPGA